MDHTHRQAATGGEAADVRPGAIAWLGTGVTLASYLVLMLAVAYVPSALGAPLIGGTALSIGIVAGVAVIVILMIASAAYTSWRSRRG
jgi:uncharacterized membrane protein (DUF485 family)